MPGGNTRTVLHFSPFPLTIVGGEGCRLRDLDGHTYADFLGEYTAGLYGHSHPVIQAAIKKVVDDGMALGGPNPYEAELAAELCRRFPSVERVRFCNSGTESNLFAFSTARLVTGRPAIMVFHGAYHGGVFYFGQHKTEINAPFPWIYADYNDIEGTLALIEKHARELAAVAIEPMMGGAGGIPATREFLQALRTACTKHGIVLIFDEVMTIEDTWGGDIATAAIAHLARSTPAEFLFSATDFNSYVTRSIAKGAPQRKAGRMSSGSRCPTASPPPRADRRKRRGCRRARHRRSSCCPSTISVAMPTKGISATA